MNCPQCGSDNWIVELLTGSDGGPSGLSNRCCQCQHAWRPDGAGNVAPRIERGQPVPIQRQQAPQKAARRVTAKSVVADAKQELRRLDKEIARLEKLKRQRAELARLLDAAKGSPSAVVELRRTSQTG